MAKKIKAITCPQCGSNKKTRLDEDHYRCDNCGTEYFLDNDDININVHHDTKNDYTSLFETLDRIKYFFLLIPAFFFLIFFANLYTPTKNVVTSTRQPNILAQIKTDNYHDSPKASILFAKQNKAIVFSLVGRHYHDSNEDNIDNIYAIFYDLNSRKAIKEIKTDIKAEKFSDNIQIRYFPSCKKYYAIVGRRLYEANVEDFTFTDVTDATFGRNKAFTLGVASLKFHYEHDGDILLCMTNEGKDVYYIPATNKAYTENAYQAIPETEIWGSPHDETFYTFTKKSSDFPEQKIQLIQGIYRGCIGGEEFDSWNLSWRKFYGYGIHIVNSQTPYQKILFSDKHITSFKDFTPDRLYFAPSVLYSDAKNILIKYRPIAAEDASMNLQLLDEKGNIVWTQELSCNFDCKKSVKAADGFWIQDDDNNFVHISADGKTIESIMLKKQ